MMIRGEKLTVKRILRFVKRFIFEHRKILLLRMDVDDAPDRIEYNKDIVISHPSTADLDALMRNKRPTYKTTILERFEKGDMCFIAKRGDKLCGYVWIKLKSYYFPEVYYEVEIDDRSIWIIDGIIFEEERRKRIWQQILQGVFEYCKNKGYERVYGGILSDNEASLKAHAKFGFNKLEKEIEMVKLFGIKKHKIVNYEDE